ncbi:MAG: rRNA maturation RNase YbeY [Cyclobacteriaceae bacterium]|nr:rRNA maturation RNase YbeY [Cyclobacteriaceae bacterium]
MPDISFPSKGISFRLSQPRKTKTWLSRIAEEEGRTIESLTYVFVSDSFLSKLNYEYLRHSTLTDILTFDYSEGKAVIGEIYISVPRVRENARKYQQPFDTELRRVMAHGLLHILGYKDKTSGQSSRMRRKEEACLSLWS